MSTETDAASRPWRDAETLRRLYINEDLERAEVAERVGCHPSTLDDWLTRHGIQKGQQTALPNDETELRRLYHGEEMSQAELAERFDTSQTTVCATLQRQGIETRGPGGGTDYSEMDLVRHLRRVHNQVAFRVTGPDVNGDPKAPHKSTLVSRFGGWEEALQAAGISPDARTDARPVVALNTSQSQVLSCSPHTAEKLLRLEEPFYKSSSGLSHAEHSKLANADLIRHADETMEKYTCGEDDEASSYRYRWKARDGVRRWIEQHVNLGGRCPGEGCYATGITNLGDGRFTCSDEDCDAEFGRERAQEVIQG